MSDEPKILYGRVEQLTQTTGTLGSGYTFRPAPPIAPAQWSTEPPREPGWYWSRSTVRPDEGAWPDEVLGDEPTTDIIEWWPVRIEPPADAGKGER